MATTRIFVKGLPPSISEIDFRNHFSAGGREITDVKLIPQRRIGYVGYKTPEDAQKAVKYFNKSYVRMSKVSVEPAKAVRPLVSPHHPNTNGMLDLRPVPEQASVFKSTRSIPGEKKSH